MSTTTVGAENTRAWGLALALLGAAAAGLSCGRGADGASVAKTATSVTARAHRAVTEDLRRSTAAWNRADLVAFVASYAEDAVYVSPSGITRGRAQVLARYVAKYGDRPDTMGTLSIDVLDVRPDQAPDGTLIGAGVVGRWQLTWRDRTPPEDTAQGHTLIVYRVDAEGRWRIVHDASM
ncbi:MAG: nuclear transport factor 2 family protein [Myxococcota bacterium]